MTYLDFKILYANFLKASRYMATKRLEIKDPLDPKWLNLVATYHRKIAEPLDKAWKSLTKEMKEYFSPQTQPIGTKRINEIPF